MLRDILEGVASGVAVFAFGYLLWPPGLVYWSAVSEVIGSGPTVLVVAGLCVAFGYLVRRTTPVRPAAFTAGGLLAYLAGMFLIEASMTPDSPVHRYWYGFMLTCAIAGHAGRDLLAAAHVLVDALGLTPRR